jgi:hypothetical protein
MTRVGVKVWLSEEIVFGSSPVTHHFVTNQYVSKADVVIEQRRLSWPGQPQDLTGSTATIMLTIYDPIPRGARKRWNWSKPERLQISHALHVIYISGEYERLREHNNESKALLERYSLVHASVLVFRIS